MSLAVISGPELKQDLVQNTDDLALVVPGLSGPRCRFELQDRHSGYQQHLRRRCACGLVFERGGRNGGIRYRDKPQYVLDLRRVEYPDPGNPLRRRFYRREQFDT